jgi:hypothetical protein
MSAPALNWRDRPALRRNEVALLLGISIRQVDYMIARDELATKRVGRVVLVLTHSLTEWFDETPKPEAQRTVSPEARAIVLQMIEKAG